MNAPQLTGSEIKNARVRVGLTQTELAERLGVAQTAVSAWELGKSQPRADKLGGLARVLGLRTIEPSPDEEFDAPSGSSAFGEWLSRTRNEKKLTRHNLAALSEVSHAQIWNIENGQTLNPRAATRERLERALQAHAPQEAVEQTERDAEIPNVGHLTDFNPHDANDLPSEPGVYVLYDISERPIYVGESAEISSRIRDHADKFWFKPPIVETASYVRIDNKRLRGQVEQTMIKFLKSNAVVNQKHVRR